MVLVYLLDEVCARAWEKKTKSRHNFNDGKSLILSVILKNMQNSHKK
jgi:hypothetical protein